MKSIEGVIARRLIKVSTAILTNLVLNENVVPEFIQEDCTPEKLADALLPLFKEGPQRQRQVEAFKRLDAIMGIGTAEPARHAAQIVLAEAARKRTPQLLHVS